MAREGWDLLIRRHLSLTVIGVIFVVCLMSALATGYWLPTRLSYVILLGVPIAYFWAKLNIRNLDVTVERPLDRLQEGQEYTERITVKNLHWFSKLWLEVTDPSDMPGHNANQVITLGPREARTWRTTTTCRLRGLFNVGPVQITTGDPFGFFRHTQTFGRAQSILDGTHYQSLSPERQAQYENAKRLISLSEDAIKASNFEFARNLAEKAERLAKELQNR